MRYLQLSSGGRLPVLGMGTWGFGGRAERDPENDDAAQTDVLCRGIECGFELIDTAEYYAAGHAETLVGKAIRGFDRKKLFIISKVWKNHLTRDGVLRAVENSLVRLGTDYLDSYLYHQVSEEVPLGETLGAMNELVEQGIVRSIGVSNFSAERMLRAISLSSAPIVINQVHCNLAVRDAFDELDEICREKNVVLQAWRPIRDIVPSEEIADLCRSRGIPFARIALAWLLNKRNVAVVTAMKNPEHLDETFAAAETVLTEEEIALLDGYPLRKPCTVPLS